MRQERQLIINDIVLSIFIIINKMCSMMSQLVDRGSFNFLTDGMQMMQMKENLANTQSSIAVKTATVTEAGNLMKHIIEHWHKKMAVMHKGTRDTHKQLCFKIWLGSEHKIKKPYQINNFNMV